MKPWIEKYGKVALVTGATSGIGEAFAIDLAAQGFDLILVSRKQDSLDRLRDSLLSRHRVFILAVAEDLGLPGAAGRVFEKVREAGLNVDLLVNAAGATTVGEFTDLDLEREGRLIDLNCRAPMELTHLFSQHMKKRKRGGILFFSSTLIYFPIPYFSTYSATKAFELVFGESLYCELKPYGIDVLTVIPGYTKTGFQRAAGIRTDRMPWPPRTPEQVLRSALRSLGRKPYVIDGGLNRLSVVFSKLLPARWILRLGRWAIKSPSQVRHSSLNSCDR